MKQLNLILFIFLFSNVVTASEYIVTTKMGHKKTIYKILESKKGLLTVISPRKDKPNTLSKKDSRFLKTKLEGVLGKKTNKLKHCPRDYILTRHNKKIVAGCLSSKTKAAKSSRDLVNTLANTDFL